MSEYTPTTEQVSVAYTRYHCKTFEEKEFYIRHAEFERWIAEHDRAIAEKAFDEGWDKGFDAGEINASPLSLDYARNPYHGKTE